MLSALVLLLVHAEEAGPVARLSGREQALSQQARAAQTLARQEARTAYRLARRRDLGFMPDGSTRLEHAQALDLALVALARSVGEQRALEAELARVRADRAEIERVLAAESEKHGPPPKLQRPCRGTLVAEPGLRRDPGTSVELPQRGLQFLARMNEPVHAPAGGTIRRVETLPQGGLALVLEHPGGWVSVISGLREVAVVPGQAVDANAAVGLTGRNLDGAPVVTYELWRGRTPIDPRPLIR